MRIGVLLTLLAGLSLALPMPGFSADRAAKAPKSKSVSQTEEAEVIHPEVSRITAEELKQLIDKEGEYVLVDSRDSARYDQRHIKGAVNLFYNPTGDPVALEMMLLGLPMDKLIIIYCS